MQPNTFTIWGDIGHLMPKTPRSTDALVDKLKSRVINH